jgi:type II secretory pathway component PulF
VSAATYRFEAVDKSGARQGGTIHAPSQSEAFRLVSAQGLVPLSIRPVLESGAGLLGLGGLRGLTRARIRSRDIGHFTSQMAVLVSARIPISDGLQSIAEQESNPALRAVVHDVARRIEAGESLANAMQAHRSAFGETYVETVRAAERSGNLVKVMEHLAEMLDRAEETRRQVWGALMYPAVVSGVLVLGVTFLIGFVVPKFSRMFESRGVKLPALTQVMVFAGDVVQGYWWALLAGLVGGFLGFRAFSRTEHGRIVIDRALHRVPVLRTILIGLAVSRFAHVLGVSLSSGLGLIESLELSSRASARPMLSADVNRMVQEVKGGGRLSAVLQRCAYLTPFTKRMLAAGETSGELPRMCSVVARQYDRETSALAKNLATILEPVLVVLIAASVLVIALSVFLPMWEMVNLVGK